MFRRKPVNTALNSPAAKPVRTTRDTGSWFMLAALICAVLTGFFVVGFLKAAVPSATVYVAKADISPGDTLSPNMFEAKKLPAGAVPQERVRDLGAVAGKHARTFIAAGDPLRKTHVIELNAGSLAARLSLENNPGYRAAALPKDASQGLKAELGDRVDLYGFIPMSGKDKPPEAILLAEGAPVLMAAEKDKNTGQETGIVIAVNQETAQKISMVLGMNGKLYAVLTPPKGESK